MVQFKRLLLMSCTVVLSACGTLGQQGKEPAETRSAAPAARAAQAEPKAKPPLEPARPKAPPPVPETAAPSRAEKGPAPEESAAPHEPPARNVASANASIDFPLGSAELDASGAAALREHAARLKKTPKLVVTLVAYSDALGSRNYNLAVAEERMNAVTDTLRSLGVARGQIRRVNAGYRLPPVTCRTPPCPPTVQGVELVYEE